MQEFLHIALSLPTAAFTMLLGLVVLYWLTVIMGVMDIDLFDLEGGFDVEVDLDLDADLDLDLDGPGGLVGVLDALGLAGIPLTISMSLLVFYGWCVSFIGIYALLSQQVAVTPLWQAGVSAAALAIGLATTSLSVKPFKTAGFGARRAPGASEALIGSSVRIISGRVDAGARPRGSLSCRGARRTSRCAAMCPRTRSHGAMRR